MRILTALLIALALQSCSDGAPEEDCPITVDSVSIVDSLEADHVTYYLVHRISGWSDKTESLELYDSKPAFDLCAKSNKEPIFADSLEQSMEIKHIYLDASRKTLDIEYADTSEGIVHNKFRLEIR